LSIFAVSHAGKHSLICFQAISKPPLPSLQHIATSEANPLGIEDKNMNAIMADDLRVYARQRWPLANDKYRKARLANLLQVSARRIKSLWEGEQSAVIRQSEAEAVRRLLGQKQIEEANRNDFQALQARIARLEAALSARDPEFHHDQVAALRVATDGRRRGHVPGGTRYDHDDPDSYSD